MKHSNDIWKELKDKGPSTDEEWDLMVENEPQHVTYIDELLCVLEETTFEVSHGIEDWLENLKEVLLCK